jgi:hypothetical protein
MKVIRKEKRHVFGRVSSWSNRCVVVYDRNRCIAKQPERTHVMLRDVTSLRRGKCSGKYKGNLYCLASELAFLAMRYSVSLDHTS